MPEMTFWFEFASTYSYPAAMRVEAEAEQAGVAVKWRPFLLGPIFAAQGWNDSPFNIYPAKGQYMWRDLTRICAALNIPLRLPPVRFPQNGLSAARIAFAGQDEPWIGAFVRAVYGANFALGQDISAPETLTTILGGLGLDASHWMTRAQDPDIKDAFKRQNQKAMQLGIFGAPSFTIAEELFWGNDRLTEALAWASAKPQTA